MSYNSKSKVKVLYLLKILREETNAEHGLSMPQIIQRLAEHGVSAERKSIYADLDALREFGIDVRTYRTSPVEYGVVPDEFSLEELMVMVDAVQSCRAITQRQADSLVRSIKRLTNKEDREVLDRCIHVEGRIKSKSDSVLSTVDKIHDAIRSKSSVTLAYKRASSVDGAQAPSRGKKHKVTPIEVAYDDGFYYLTAWDEDSGEIREFRLDRIRGMIAGEPDSAAANEQIRGYGRNRSDAVMFGRFGGEEIEATLAFVPDKVEIVTDRFGAAARILSRGGGFGEGGCSEYDSMGTARVRVCKSTQFFGWVAGMDKVVRIVGPQRLVDEYRDYLRSLLKE